MRTNGTGGEEHLFASDQSVYPTSWSPDGRFVLYGPTDLPTSTDLWVVPMVGESTPSVFLKTPFRELFGEWSPDGKALYYLNPAGEMMAAPITVVGDTLEPGAPGLLFPTRIVGGGVDAQQGRQYDVAPDGRFLINTELPGDAAPITLIQNWNPDANR